MSEQPHQERGKKEKEEEKWLGDVVVVVIVCSQTPEALVIMDRRCYRDITAVESLMHEKAGQIGRRDLGSRGRWAFVALAFYLSDYTHKTAQSCLVLVNSHR